MNNILFRNSNFTIIRKITKRELKADAKRNFFIFSAILLTTFMITSIFSIGMSYFESINMREKRMQGSVSQMAFAAPTKEQLSKLYSIDYIKTIGIAAPVATTKSVPGMNGLPISYVDKSQWDEMFQPTFTGFIGSYPEKENEIMLSRYILEALGIKDARIGMTIPLSFSIEGAIDEKEETFILSGLYTEYIHARPGGYIAIYCSSAFAEKYNALRYENMTVNIIFDNDKNVEDSIERLKIDLPFYEGQSYIQSPAFDETNGNLVTYLSLSLLILFLVFSGYLLIYNVMQISIEKNVRFFGMLKTIGTTPSQIRRIVIGQVFQLCILSIPLGSVISTIVSLVLVPAILVNSGIDTEAVISFSPLIYFGAVVFALLTAFLGAFAPAKLASKISPINALHFSGNLSTIEGSRFNAKGRPMLMALKNIFRDKKRALIVFISLFLGITVFTSILTIVNSMDLDDYINAEYDYDFYFSSKPLNSYFLSDDFIQEVEKIDGVEEKAITTIGYIELMYEQSLAGYQAWITEKENLSSNSIVTDGYFSNVNTIKGIDPLDYEKINNLLDSPIDKEKFEKGKIALINVTEPSLFNYLNNVSSLQIKRKNDISPILLNVGGIVALPSKYAGSSFGFSSIEILVSNSYLHTFITEYKTLSLGMNVKDGYDEILYKKLEVISKQNDIEMVSRYEGRRSLQDTKTIMLVLGGGISAILGCIGILNFVNVMSVGVMTRRREFAILESIGMSKKQLESMLHFEGIGYAMITILACISLGNLIGWAGFKLFKNFVEYARYEYPVLPVLTIYLVILIISWFAPQIAYQNISKDTLVERLRKSE